MSSVRVLTMVLLLALTPLGVLAQGSGSETEVLVDGSDDTEYTLEGNVLPGTPVDTAIDLSGLYLEEAEDELFFRVQVQDLSDESHAPLLGEGRITIDFRLGDIDVVYYVDASETGPPERVTAPRDQYRIELDHDLFGATARLMQFDVSRDAFVPAYEGCEGADCSLQVEARPEQDSWRITVPRERLQDADGATPSPGLRLHGFLVTSTAALTDMSFDALAVKDTMPTDGEPAGEFRPTLGEPAQIGHIRLGAQTPYRWSNGEATTYVYDVTLTKLDEVQDEVTLSVADVPKGWEVRLPATSMVLDGAQALRLPIALTTPFSHEHGELETFFVEARSARDADAIGRVELGIRYSDIPQPTGHHSRIWIHAAEPEGEPLIDTDPGEPTTTDQKFMSSLDVKDQPGSIDALIAPDRNSAYDPADADMSWAFPLEPPLRTGLDFDMDSKGEVAFTFESDVEIPEAVIFGALYFRDPQYQQYSDYYHQYDKVLATFYSSAAQDIPAGEPTTFTAAVQGTKDGDYLPYRPEGAYVFMVLTLRFDSQFLMEQQGLSPLLRPGGTIDLPLEEYKDPVQAVYRPLNDVTLEVQGDTRQSVNTGESVLFTLLLNNTGVANEEFTLGAESLNADWVTYLDGTHVAVPSNGQETIRVLVTPPPGSWDGRIAGPLLTAVSTNDPWAQAATRIHVEVDDDEDHEDMSYLLGSQASLDGGVDTPGVGVIPMLVGLALVALAVRTRRL